MNDFFVHTNRQVPRIKTKFDTPETRLSTTNVKDLVRELEHDQVQRCIYIVKEAPMNSTPRRVFERLKPERNLHIELFDEREVLINITEHDLVPRHVPLDRQQKAELLDRYKIQDALLPRILRSDPVVRYFGVEVGTVLEITRKSETAG
jgi:DNA-directed RNA polymerase I, II, and III subunit RPABC1